MTRLPNRRHILASGLGAAAATLLSACAGVEPRGGLFARRKLPIGVQLYTVADAAKADLDGTFARLRAIGFETVELAGYHGYTPAALRAAADRHGLRFTSIHLQGRALGPGPALDGDLSRIAADMRVLGIDDVVMPLFRIPVDAPPRAPDEGFIPYLARVSATFTADYWRGEAAFLNRTGAALKREGLRFGYHNHNPEFAPMGDTSGFEILMRETDPAQVMFEMDAGWVAAAGLDPAALLRAWPGRFRLMHVKDIRATTRTNFALQQDPTQVGDGMIDWGRLLPAAMAAGVTRFFVEQEPPFQIDRFDALARSLTALRAL